jgi:hypothetical protein
MRDAGAGDRPVTNRYDTESSAPSGEDTTDLSARLRTLLDRQEIADVVARYCRGIDRRDFDLVRACYHPDGADRHTGFSGGIDEYITWLASVLADYPATQHLVGQQLIEIQGDIARCETYGIATHWVGPTGDPRLDYTSGFRYVDRMERRGGEWRIAERLAVRDWTRKETGQFVPREGEGPTGAPSHADPLYHLPGWPPAERLGPSPRSPLGVLPEPPG